MAAPRTGHVPLGMLALALLFLGQFALHTNLRPFPETVTRVGVSTLPLLLLLMGVAGPLGTYLIGVLLWTRLHGLLIALPLAMAGITVALTVLGGALVPVAILLAGWGLIGTAAPVGWWTWLSRVLPPTHTTSRPPAAPRSAGPGARAASARCRRAGTRRA